MAVVRGGAPQCCRHRCHCLPPSESGWKSKGSSGVGSTHEVGSDDGQFNQSGRCCKTLSSSACQRLPRVQQAVRGLIHGNSWRVGRRRWEGGGQEEF